MTVALLSGIIIVISSLGVTPVHYGGLIPSAKCHFLRRTLSSGLGILIFPCSYAVLLFLANKEKYVPQHVNTTAPLAAIF